MTTLREAAQQALDSINELFAAEQSEGGERGRHIRTPATREHLVRVAQARRALHESCDTLRAALAQPVPHGCHVDLDNGMKPDGCVLDDGRPENCIYAKRLLREGKDKTACEYWQPIEVTR